MASKKKWATRFGFPGAPTTRHESGLAVWRWVDRQRELWAQGALLTPHLTVLVDEHDGAGWRTFEKVDLSDGATSLRN